MYKASVNGGSFFELERDQHSLKINGQAVDWSMEQTGPGRYSVIYDHKSYIVLLNSRDGGSGNPVFRIRGVNYEVKLADPVEQTLQGMGIAPKVAGKLNEIRAPMPGLVLKIQVSIGQKVKKGESLLILEAMKMENLFKSPSDGTIQEIRVKEGLPVEKGGILIILE